MALVLRYVDKNSEVAERFVGLVHVSDTLACSLKEAIYSLLSEHSLSPSQIRGQGYDGATIAKKHLDVKVFFCHVTNVLNVIGRSFKRRDLLRLLQDEKLEQLLESVSSDLLLGMASLNPTNSFANFDKGRIMTLAKCYPNEFDEVQIRDLSYQLDTFIIHMRAGNPKFSNLQGISDLAKALVEANLVETYSYVYLLVKLTLILHVATAIVERAFSSMKQIKNEEWNNMGDQYLNDCLVCYIERDVFTN
uniref:DUF4371 domain-containing protein n=1 Tax=Nicotiana tabacum TaxID=4097 RepID=A0A1S3X9Y4_TOBAC